MLLDIYLISTGPELAASLGFERVPPGPWVAVASHPFVRDGKTLEVDASGLRADAVLAQTGLTLTEAASAVATSVLICWTEHS